MVSFAEDLKETVWIAPSSVVSGVRQFGTPVAYALNCRITSSNADLIAFGPKFTDYRRAVAPNEYVATIHSFDKVWIGATPSDPTDKLASDANFEVVAREPGVGGTALVMFKKLTNDV